MRYDLNLLPVFVALMEERSVTRAALRLGMTQAAVSNALARLRGTLQDPLFIRERYSMRPTPKAEALAPVLASALASMDAVVLGQQAFDPARADHQVTIAPNSYVEFVLVPRLVARLSQLAPGIRLRTLNFGTDLAETGVSAGDTAMVLGRIEEAPDNLVVQHIADDGLACVVRADHPVIGNRIGKNQYERLKHVNVLPSGRLRTGVFQALQRQGLKREVVASVTHFASIPEIIAATDYCATLPRLICQRLVQDRRLKVLSTPVDLGSFPLHMAWHVRYRDDPAHGWLRKLVAETAAAL
ncbi:MULTISPECIES: LysR family transcriptional regulator [Herbaspirillum]|jgi:DNA-binding transcriptional LysR family regulator|uniref:LysR family transcriptional regulator n=3 Tax=Oxalobacteraceae TaxID=75682 RepID=UPI000C0BB636|nr:MULTISPECIES: LysR family transcriptional regulator [Herbaspirillum]MAF02127.1 LysR family transcriptional regulator [Herbaspirillum sp.]MCP3653610.1 LysR family transcriptional regulator [Herbaspirillum sp.]MCP3947400.1 LysR family transcriptional regulator [Herbaspirillum sp.]MCP4034630.1 LysR family transcriptional regulator [Herbaspirillum sp.]MCP4555221.1 LysR family transcriptional regulator [Herbaspirillum sp.]|tara:strand:+ start:11035 stop:11931 length:897 start_codon:yes stop_codon:yes gene_type:complete